MRARTENDTPGRVLDLFRAGAGGRVIAATYGPEGGRQQSRRVAASVEVPAGAVASAVSHSSDTLDLFVAGHDVGENDGQVWSAAWEPGLPGWQGWWRIGNLDPGVEPGAPVTAISRARDRLDIFVAANDERVWTASWAPDQGGWQGWKVVGDLRVRRGAPVTAMSRGVDRLDLFVTGSDCHVWTASRAPSGSGWQGWTRVTPVSGRPGAIGDLNLLALVPVNAVSGSEGGVEIFVVADDGGVWTAVWASASDGWHGWWRLSPADRARAQDGPPATAVSGGPDRLDIFMLDRMWELVWTAAWAPDSGGWRGWWNGLRGVSCLSEGVDGRSYLRV